MSRSQPKFDDLSVLERVDSNSSDSDRDKVFPVMSISKSFCGAVCALMAVDGEFGEKGVDATLDEVLEQAKSQHAAGTDQRDKIEKYQIMLRQREFGNVTIAELLTHRSGCCDAYKPKANSYKGRRFDFFNEQLGRGEFRRGEYNYSNDGYMLIEEVVNLVSKRGSYEQELRQRIFTPLNLSKTNPINDSPEGESRIGRAIFLPGTTSQSTRKTFAEREEHRGDQIYACGQVSTAAGGICSTVNDLEKFSLELARMIAGQPNLLTKSPKISEIYRRGAVSDNGFCSLGIDISSSQDGKLTIDHNGGFEANSSNMQVVTPYDFSDFISGKTVADRSDDFKSEIYLQLHDHIVYKCLAGREAAGSDTEGVVRAHFFSMMDDSERQQQEYQTVEDLEKYLIAKERLSPDFRKTVLEIYKGFEVARARVSEFLVENYLDENGVIDSKKIAQDFRSNEDIERIFSRSKIKEALDAAQEKARELLGVRESFSPAAAPRSPRATAVAVAAKQTQL